MLGQIDLSNAQVDHVGECFQMTDATRLVFDGLGDAIESFGDGVGRTGSDDGQYGVLVVTNGKDLRSSPIQPMTTILLYCIRSWSAVRKFR